jgi:hypothetical protein
VNGLSQTDSFAYFFFFAAVFFLAGAFFLAFEVPFFLFIGMVASLLRSVALIEPLSSQALSSTATHHPHAADYMEGASAGQQTNAILEIFF